MLFSIIIPIYNTGSYLDECIGSVIRQDYHDFELILIDDGSTDSSAEICRRWKEKDSRIMLITKENQGTARTRNVGLNCVRGDYILFLDSDDKWTSCSVLSNIKKRIELFNADVISFNFSKTKGDKISAPYFSFTADYSPDKDGNCVDFMRENHLWISCAWNKVIRRDLIQQQSLFFFEEDLAEDIGWCYRLGKTAKIFDYIGMTCVFYRQRKGSVSKTITAEKISGMVDIYQNVFDDLNSMAQSSKKKMLEDYYAYLLVSYLADIALLNDKTIENEFKSKLKPLMKVMKCTNRPIIKYLYWFYHAFGFNNTLRAIRLIKS